MKKKITEIADIQLGYQFRKKIEPVDNGTNWVIQIRDFDENHILNKEGLSRVRVDKPVDRYLIHQGDVLFLSRGHRNWAAAIVDDLKDTVVVVSHFFVIRRKNATILPEYLAWYMNQTPAQEYLHNIARRGTHMPLVTLSAFKGLTVEVPDMATQHSIVELSRLMGRERKLRIELQQRRLLLINAISLKAIKTRKEK
ncbi:MAG: restriction endonuclease subunit S [Nitrospirae bacterium]|nr:restriction endonuclease subunit S [Nitrospirota bacterium]MBI5096575.1 restriction endonuclease subunit S [Nitrospirota bacterium]